MTVCAQCERFGSAEWTPIRPRPPPKEQQPRNEVEAVERLALLEDFGDKIRAARQRENMTVEELAKKIGEKESVVKNLEKEELIPSETLVKKLRNILKIELLVAEETAPAKKLAKPSGERTLGDLIKLKQSSKKETEESEAPEAS